MKKDGIIAVGSLLGSSLLMPISAQAQNSTEDARPNFVLIIADDISQRDFGCYGHPVVRTPHIDALAADGVMFDKMVLTASSSSPSRASILTGRYPHNTGACELHTLMGDEQVLFTRLLKDAGYYTAQAGKWHIGPALAKKEGPAYASFDRTGGDRKDGGGDSGSERWVDYLRERPAEKPFFMWFASHDAHRTWDDNIFLERYDPEKVDVSPFYYDDAPTREEVAAYYNEISRFDHFVGEVVKELRAQGIYDNTVMIVMADNGRSFPRAKTHLIQDGIFTPFIVHYPVGMQKRGMACGSLVSAIDIAPTVMELAGLPSAETFQGRSFAELLKDPSGKFRTYAFAERNWHDFEAYERMVCTEEYIYIENSRTNFMSLTPMHGATAASLKEAYAENKLDSLQADVFRIPKDPVALYEYGKDTLQLNNIVAEEPVVTECMESVLRQWQRETADTQPEELTPDWYSRTDGSRLPAHGKRGEMPGSAKNAARINASGPF